MIERVEVMRGGGSALFGSNAIAGTINIITKEPKNNSISVSNITNMIGGSAPDNNLAFHASLVDNDLKNGLLVFGSNRQRDAFDYDKDGFTEIGKLEGSNIGMRAFYKFNNYKRLTAEYHLSTSSGAEEQARHSTPLYRYHRTDGTQHPFGKWQLQLPLAQLQHKFMPVGTVYRSSELLRTQGDPNKAPRPTTALWEESSIATP